MKKNKPLVLVLLGPTASGKTSLAIDLAKRLNLKIHNIDSRQIYIGMDIGTAKPTREQQKLVEHYLVDICSPDHPINLHEFKKTALLSLEPIINSGEIGFLVGGSGLYLKSITGGFIPPAVPPQTIIRKQLTSLGQETCHQLLKETDPIAGSKISKADTIRTQRALEVIYATGKGISKQQKSDPPQWKVLELGLDPKNLKERIAKRTSEIYSEGIIEETQKLVETFGKSLPLLQTIGYKEALEVLEGRLNLQEAIGCTNRRTQQFAKRQRTWFKNKHSPHWLNDEEPLREALSIIQTGLGYV